MLMLMIKYKKLIPFIKYTCVGISGTIIDVVLVYWLYSIYHISLFWSTFLAFIFAATNNFILNRFWTFHTTNTAQTSFKRQYIKFLLVSSIGLILTICLMYIAVDRMHIHVIFAKIGVSVVVLSWNFLANKLWTFAGQMKLVYHPMVTWDELCRIFLSIIIPAYNERNRIGKTLDDLIVWQSNHHDISSEIIIVDDGSTDTTLQYVQETYPSIRIFHIVHNQGKWHAIAHGIEKAQWKYSLIFDADSSTPVYEIDKVLSICEQYDVIIGSRYLSSSRVKLSQSSLRHTISRIGNTIIQLVLLDGIEDTQCGFKLFHTEKAQALFALQKIRRWGFDIEILFLAKAFGFSIHEVGVEWHNDTDSRFRAIRDSLRTLQDLVIIKLAAWFGGYKQ